EQFGTAADKRYIVHTESLLQQGEAPELIEDHVSHRLAPQLDDDAHSLTVAFIANVGDALEFLLLDQIRHLFDQRGLVHLIGNFADDDRLALLANLFGMHASPHDNRPAARMSRGLDAGAAQDNAAGGKIGTGNDVSQFVDRDFRVLDDPDAAVDHLAQ